MVLFHLNFREGNEFIYFLKQLEFEKKLTQRITQEKEKLLEENYFIDMKYQELKVKHNELLKSHRANEEKLEEFNESLSKRGDLTITTTREKEGVDSNDSFKINETFDFSPYNYKRAHSVAKTSTHFSIEKNLHPLLHPCKTVFSEINLAESLKEAGIDESPNKKESNADLLEKDSFANNTSVLTNSDISKLKPEILEKLKDNKEDKRPANINMNLIKSDLKINELIINQPPNPELDPVQYYEDLRSNVVAIKYESCLKEEIVAKAKTPEKKPEETTPNTLNVNEQKMKRKSSFIEFTPLPSSFVGKGGKKENSATRKSSRKSSDHMEKIHEFEEDHAKSKDEIIEEREKPKSPVRPVLEKKQSICSNTKKQLFEEFLLIGIEKEEFLKIDTSTQNLKGYLTPNIMFEYPKADESNEAVK